MSEAAGPKISLKLRPAEDDVKDSVDNVNIEFAKAVVGAQKEDDEDKVEDKNDGNETNLLSDTKPEEKDIVVDMIKNMQCLYHTPKKNTQRAADLKLWDTAKPKEASQLMPKKQSAQKESSQQMQLLYK